MEQNQLSVEAMSKQQLADHGQGQVLQLMRAGKQLLDFYSQPQPTSEAQEQLQALQQQYLKTAADIQSTLQQCHVLQQQEAAAATTASQQPDAAEREAAAVADLQAQAAQLKQQLQDKNQAIKQVINKLRHMIDAFNMWESHRRHLTQHAVQYAATGTGSML